MNKNASLEDINAYINSQGFNSSDFSDLLSNYNPTDENKWYEFWK